MLKQTLLADPVQRAIIEATPTTVDDVVQERIAVLQKVWPGFSAWWKDYFKVETDEGIPIDALWRVYLPFSQWIVEQKRAKAPTDGDPNALYVVGVYGSQGRGKTVISRALVPVLNALLDPVREGQAVARAIDDYYLSQEERDALRASGYDPGEQGVSNRGPAGTHDTKWILCNLHECRTSTAESSIQIGNYDKRIDNYPDARVYRARGITDYPEDTLEVEGKVGVFLLDGWFVGANTDFDVAQIPKGTFPRIVAEALRADYKSIFDQFDALWAFDTPTVDEIQRNRETQEQLQEKQRGSRQMSPAAIKAFVNYFYVVAWREGVTSPVPDMKDVTFLATIDRNWRAVKIEPGGRDQLQRAQAPR